MNDESTATAPTTPSEPSPATPIPISSLRLSSGPWHPLGSMHTMHRVSETPSGIASISHAAMLSYVHMADAVA